MFISTASWTSPQGKKSSSHAETYRKHPAHHTTHQTTPCATNQTTHQTSQQTTQQTIPRTTYHATHQTTNRNRLSRPLMSLSSHNSSSSLDSSSLSDSRSSSFEEYSLTESFVPQNEYRLSEKGSTLSLAKLCRFNLFSKNYKISRGSSTSPDPSAEEILGASYSRRRSSTFYHRYNFQQPSTPELSLPRPRCAPPHTSEAARHPQSDVGNQAGNHVDGARTSPGTDAFRKFSISLQQQAHEERLQVARPDTHAADQDASTHIKYDDNPEEMVLPEFNSVPLEVTVRLLEGERRRMVMFQRELSQCLMDPHTSKKNIEWLTENIARVEKKYRSLEEEFRQACLESLIRRLKLAKKSSRSQPAIGVKQTPKTRPTIFGTVAEASETPKSKKSNRESIGPQMLSLAQMFGSCSGYVGTNNNHSRPELDAETLIFQNGNLHSGPLEALIQHLVPTADYYPDRTYTFAFLLSSRLFIRPHELLGQVFKLCVLQQNLSQDNNDNSIKIERSRMDKFGLNIVNLLSEWTEMFPYDFRDELMMKQLRDITQRVIGLYPELRKDINNLSYNLVTKLTNLKSYEENLTKLDAEEQRNLGGQVIPTTDITEICPSPLALAQQLTHIELERLSMIGPEEFVQAFVKERSKPEENVNKETYTKDTRNLESYVQWFNRLSYFVASEITSHAKKKARVKVIEYFIDVAKECINIGNFNSLMAVIAGMNLSPVTRLKKTWAKVNKDKLKILEHQMDPSNNFGSYRSCLKAAMWRSEGAAEEREKIVIPFFSLFVKDLYFLNEGCSNKQADGTVNFQKCWQMAKQISDLIAWQQVECPFERIGSVRSYILTSPIYKESMLSLASYECEAPETNFDKERFKQLKLQPSLPSKGLHSSEPKLNQSCLPKNSTSSTSSS